MGRQLKRVPMDFSAPLNKTWEGYLNPHYKACPDCKNGYTAAGERLKDIIMLLMLSGSDSVTGKNHPCFDFITQGVYGFNSVPSPDMRELTEGLAGRPLDFLGHDACDKWSAAKKIIAAAGLPEDWGTCKTCDGESIAPEAKEAYESWKETHPPVGDGYQMWENTSEGSPQTPVFATLKELAEYCAEHCTTFGSQKASAEDWMRMLRDDLVYHQEGGNIFM